MITVADIMQFMESFAPRSTMMDWDNAGLLCGSSQKEVKKILIALDPFEAVAEEAAEIGADLIVTHHPLIFVPVKNVTEETSIGRTILLLAANGISAVNAHTNLDVAAEGVNQVLAKKLGLQDIQVISPMGTNPDGTQWGLLRKGIVEPQPLSQFLSHVKSTLHCPALRYTSGKSEVHRVAVGGGACGSELLDAWDAGCDTFITSDVKYNQFWDAQDLGMNIIDAGHFYTENPVCDFLKDKLQSAFPELCIRISERHHDCMKFF